MIETVPIQDSTKKEVSEALRRGQRDREAKKGVNVTLLYIHITGTGDL